MCLKIKKHFFEQLPNFISWVSRWHSREFLFIIFNLIYQDEHSIWFQYYFLNNTFN